jgi:hypothetical protein
MLRRKRPVRGNGVFYWCLVCFMMTDYFDAGVVYAADSYWVSFDYDGVRVVVA